MEKTNYQTYTVAGEALLKKIRELVKEGNARKVTIADKSGRELMTFPLTVGVAGALLAPVMAALGALAAMVTECTLKVVHEPEPTVKN
ncbi:MAG TPA: DUF4342 domain-containing protein [Chitinophagaceae bacterium]